MNPQDRARLVSLGHSPEVVARTEEVLRVWEVEVLFTTCTYCRKLCLVPELCTRQTKRRKKLPADLFLNRHFVSVRDSDGDPQCLPCYDREHD